MRLPPKPSDEYDIETEFGRVHAYRFGQRQGSAIVLLHGRSGTAAMWQPNIEALAERSEPVRERFLSWISGDVPVPK